MRIIKKFKNVSLKIGLLLLAAGAFIALCTFNVILGLSDYDKTPIVSLTLEALADGESGSGESSPVASCLQAHVEVSGQLPTTSTPPKGCWRRVNSSTATKEGTIYFCTSNGATTASKCIAISCKSASNCFTLDDDDDNN